MVSSQLYSIYCSCRTQNGDISIYKQHRNYCLEKGEVREPLADFWEDLVIELKMEAASGSGIVIGVDINQYAHGEN